MGKDISSEKCFTGFAVGFGLEKQKYCRTNEVGPDIYQECGKETIYAYKGTKLFLYLEIFLSDPGIPGPIYAGSCPL